MNNPHLILQPCAVIDLADAGFFPDFCQEPVNE